MTKEEKAARRKAALKRCRDIVDLAKKEERGLATKESEEFDALKREATEIYEDLERTRNPRVPRREEDAARAVARGSRAAGHAGVPARRRRHGHEALEGRAHPRARPAAHGGRLEPREQVAGDRLRAAHVRQRRARHRRARARCPRAELRLQPAARPRRARARGNGRPRRGLRRRRRVVAGHHRVSAPGVGRPEDEPEDDPDDDGHAAAAPDQRRCVGVVHR